MEIKSTKINSANAEIEATISMDEVHANIEKIAKELAKTADVQGFRKGKVPISVVKQKHGQKLIEDAEAEALRGVLADGLKELDISNESLIGEPNISRFDKSDDKIEVSIKVAMRPEIKVSDIVKFVPDFTKPEVSDEDVDARLADLADNQAALVDIEEKREMKNGDIAVIDFEGSVDGVVFEGGTGKDFALTLGSGQFIPGFEEQLIGVQCDADIVVKVTFPESYGGELAGKEAEFKVKVNKIQTKEKVEINDELAKKMMPGEENANLDELKKQVKTQLETESLSKLYNEDLKPQLLETLVDSLTFDLPEFVIEQEIDMALNKKASTMKEEEITELREDDSKLLELRETFREDALRSVKATFIIDSLAQDKNVKIEEREIMQTIYFEAMQTGQDPQKTYEQYKEAGYLPAIQMSMVEDRVLTAMLNEKIEA